MLPLQGKLVSSHKGEYAGPCPFTGAGRDRFHWWDNSNGARLTWYCRDPDGCSSCPGKTTADGGRTGFFDDDNAPKRHKVLQHKRQFLPLDQVMMYHRQLDGETLDYLAGRGINAEATLTFKLGRVENRVTIPCLIKNGKPQPMCYGIKRRYIGTPPEAWIQRYTMDPGSTGKAIFNFNRIKDCKTLEYIFIVEGVLDCIMLDRLGIRAVAPFGGAAVWDPKWTKVFKNVKDIYVVSDNDEAGMKYAERKVRMLGRGHMVFPPGPVKDLGEAFERGGIEYLRHWSRDVRKWELDWPSRANLN